FALASEKYAVERRERRGFIEVRLGSSRQSRLARGLGINCRCYLGWLLKRRWLRRRHGLFLDRRLGHFRIRRRRYRLLYFRRSGCFKLLRFLFPLLPSLPLCLFNRLQIDVKKKRFRRKPIPRQQEVLIFFKRLAASRSKLSERKSGVADKNQRAGLFHLIGWQTWIRFLLCNCADVLRRRHR